MEPTGKNSRGTFIQMKIYESTNRDINGFRGGCLTVQKKLNNAVKVCAYSSKPPQNG